ncbi:MAG: hypothetical protein UR52_C0002G0034 [Candidatus Gottesmanbacteria bacterium GW2011_GWA1_34_13]|uniref:Large ribosomal subunit protein uL29 n=1 Tax=Candidatus Gottesmanbacteria bacterium GW2011_GWA1_34_13 TaxID=1618434 RepID=A0A0G0B7W0_9BACT|nr:MAG: hypothetical protein UR52_C0002G0034 [Candidatus Gottesmanbacteria bacterium GW2011_GWA1_34_13]
MKRKDFLSLRQKNIKDLQKNLVEKRQAITKYSLERNVKQIKNTRQKTVIKDDIAKILTVLKEFEMQKQGEKKS